MVGGMGRSSVKDSLHYGIDAWLNGSLFMSYYSYYDIPLYSKLKLKNLHNVFLRKFGVK